MATSIVQLVSIGSSVTASIAAAAAAFMSRSAVERANLAFVWAEPSFDRPDPDSGMSRLRIQLHSDGPGIALDVRWSLGGPEDPGWRAHRRAQRETASRATPAIRALRPGDRHPSLAVRDAENEDAVEIAYGGTERTVDREEPWWILVRWSDSAGRRWEFSEGSLGRELASAPCIVRRRRWLRGHPWWARMLPPWSTWTVPRLIKRQQREW